MTEVQNLNQKYQEELKAMIAAVKLAHPEISDAFIARKLKMTPQAFSYAMNISTNFSIGFYEEVKDLLRKENLIREPSQAWKDLNSSCREIEVTLFHQLELLNLKVSEIGEDEKFTEEERPQMIAVLEIIKNSICSKLDKMIKEIKEG
jgi:hypothetical protein